MAITYSRVPCERWFLQVGRYASKGEKPLRTTVCFLDRATVQQRHGRIINFTQAKPVKALAHWLTLTSAALTPACCEFALSINSVHIGIIHSYLLTLSNAGKPNWSEIPRDHIQVQERREITIRHYLFTLSKTQN